MGLAASLNRALSLCSTPFIARMDADDIAHPDRLYRQLIFLQDNENIAILGTGIETIDRISRSVGYRELPKRPDLLSKLVSFKAVCFHPTWMVRREVYCKLNGYRDFSRGQDLDFLLRATKAGFLVSNLSDHLLRYRIYEDRLDAKAMRYRLTNHMRIVSGQDRALNARGHGFLFPYYIFLKGRRSANRVSKFFLFGLSALFSNVILKYLLGLAYARVLTKVYSDAP